MTEPSLYFRYCETAFVIPNPVLSESEGAVRNLNRLLHFVPQ